MSGNPESVELLTSRERDVLRRSVVGGQSAAEIGYALGITANAVKATLNRCYGRLGVVPAAKGRRIAMAAYLLGRSDEIVQSTFAKQAPDPSAAVHIDRLHADIKGFRELLALEASLSKPTKPRPKSEFDPDNF